MALGRDSLGGPPVWLQDYLKLRRRQAQNQVPRHPTDPTQTQLQLTKTGGSETGVTKPGVEANLALLEAAAPAGLRTVLEGPGQNQPGLPGRLDRGRYGQWMARYVGCFLGLAVGDALGAPNEFRSQPVTITGMNGRGRNQTRRGEWTDDTSMALCLAHSLLKTHGLDPRDVLEHFLDWFQLGHFTTAGRAWGVGRTVRAALQRFAVTLNPYDCGPDAPSAAGNGSIMRLAPVSLFFAQPRGWLYRDRDTTDSLTTDSLTTDSLTTDSLTTDSHSALVAELDRVVVAAAASSKTTHRAREAVDGARYLAALLWGCLRGCPKEQLLSIFPSEFFWSRPGNNLAPRILAVARGSFRDKAVHELQTSGYVVHTLEAALWAFAHSDSFAEGALLAVNLGGDSDTIGAVYGQIAGAHYGEPSIPYEWVHALQFHTEFYLYAQDLLHAALEDENQRKEPTGRAEPTGKIEPKEKADPAGETGPAGRAEPAGKKPRKPNPQPTAA
ncbi:ADP-ribosylglycohydrolase [Gregarina niphandrodes]|uniref:ADP-ribosylglycohydrolase n=1 Tax=Gregarina niphandrodes TaxID=110365 RepID=A0A023AYI0_GRENI|nr:ADP-ribosylglycohydrolase [Gregarina niphandrodes]EZG43727.1 ADP-ribosylglycohydrolase [Gregarina niphandrodes]|eukprot:XP_011133036.1 ADP-ribosylglycohydrolase [Gregarina niphandrodes]